MHFRVPGSCVMDNSLVHLSSRGSVLERPRHTIKGRGQNQASDPGLKNNKLNGSLLARQRIEEMGPARNRDVTESRTRKASQWVEVGCTGERRGLLSWQTRPGTDATSPYTNRLCRSAEWRQVLSLTEHPSGDTLCTGVPRS